MRELRTCQPSRHHVITSSRHHVITSSRHHIITSLPHGQGAQKAVAFRWNAGFAAKGCTPAAGLSGAMYCTWPWGGGQPKTGRNQWIGGKVITGASTLSPSTTWCAGRHAALAPVAI